MHQRFIWIFLALTTATLLQAQESPSFHTRTDLVFLTVTVTDRNGQPFDGLGNGDFQVYEDKVEQMIEHFDPLSVPVSIGLILDRSGSMTHMIDEVYEAALHVVESSSPGDELFAMTFNSEIEYVQGFTQDGQRIREALKGLRAKGGTALFDAIYDGIRFMRGSDYKRKVLCVISDGADTESQRDFKELLELAEESEVLIYPVGMVKGVSFINWGPFGNPYVGELKELAKRTGGKAHFPRDMVECEETMKSLAEELHAQYGLGYYPSIPLSEGGWREVKVSLAKKHKKLRVRVRSGYQATAEPPNHNASDVETP